MDDQYYTIGYLIFFIQLFFFCFFLNLIFVIGFVSFFVFDRNIKNIDLNQSLDEKKILFDLQIYFVITLKAMALWR